MAGIAFPNPLGLAAGFDKDGEVPMHCSGSVSALPKWARSLRCRSRAIEAAAVPTDRGPRGDQPHGVQQSRRRDGRAAAGGAGPEGRGRHQSRREQGFAGPDLGLRRDGAGDGALCTYLAVNVSSPNTPGQRALQDEGALRELLETVKDGASEATRGKPPPIFLKVAPDLEPADIDAIARIAIEQKLGALIVSNTTIARPPLKARDAGEAGGLSGAPLRDLAQQRLKDFRQATGGAVPLVGVGGIATADDAWARIRPARAWSSSIRR